MNWLQYLLEANIYLGVFYAAYCLFLTKETHYLLNRIYLVFSCVIAFVLPVLQLGVLTTPPPPVAPAAFNAVPVEAFTADNIVAAPVVVEHHLTLQDGLWYVYLAGAMIFLVLFIIKLSSLLRLVVGKPMLKHGDYNLVKIEDAHTAFSFFSYLFIADNASDKDIIVKHELVHIRQKHSADIVFLEVLKIINWFNPLIHLIQNSLKTVHEYIADEQSVDNTNDALAYSSFLVNNAYGLTGPSIAHSFFTYNLLKKRIIMLNQQRSGRLARLKYLVAVPIGAALLCASTLGFSKTYGWIDIAPRKSTELEKPARVYPKTAVHDLPIVYSDLYTHLVQAIDYRPTNKEIGVRILVTFNLDNKGLIKNFVVANNKIHNTLVNSVIKAFETYHNSIDAKSNPHSLVIEFKARNTPPMPPIDPAWVSKPGYLGTFTIADRNTVNTSQVPPKPKVDQVKFPPPGFVPRGFKPEKTYVNAKGFKIEEGMGHLPGNLTYYVAIISDPSGKDITGANDGSHKRFVANKGIIEAEKAAYDLYGYKFPNVKVSGIVARRKTDQVKFPPPIVKPDTKGIKQLTYYIDPKNYHGTAEINQIVTNFSKDAGYKMDYKEIKTNGSNQLQISLETSPNLDWHRSASATFDLEELRKSNYVIAIGLNNIKREVYVHSIPRTDRIKFPPPAPPKPKVDQVRFPPPSILSDKATKIITTNFYRYLIKNIRYPKEAKDNNISGQIIAQFTIDDDHNITSPTLLKSLGYGCDDEVVRVLNSYKEKQPGDPGNYIIIVDMYLMYKDAPSERIPAIDRSVAKAPNLLGAIVVAAYGTH